MILYGASAEQSIAKLFVAGFLPGLLIALMMSAYVVVTRAAHRTCRTTGGFDLRHFLRTTWAPARRCSCRCSCSSGIYLGWFSPTEAGGFACLYAIIVGRYVYRTMTLERRARCAVALGDADRADPGDRRDRRAVLLDPHHQRRAAGDHELR